ncbi:MAG: hypothetical protein ACP5NU_03515 [Methanomicrobiales archaeon]
MMPPQAWIDLDGMLFPIIERDMHLVMKIFNDAMDEISLRTYPDEELRLLRFPIDFYEAAAIHYAKMYPFKPLMGVCGSNSLMEGDEVIHVDFKNMTIYSQINGVTQEMSGDESQAAVT